MVNQYNKSINGGCSIVILVSQLMSLIQNSDPHNENLSQTKEMLTPSIKDEIFWDAYPVMQEL